MQLGVLDPLERGVQQAGLVRVALVVGRVDDQDPRFDALQAGVSMLAPEPEAPCRITTGSPVGSPIVR